MKNQKLNFAELSNQLEVIEMPDMMSLLGGIGQKNADGTYTFDDSGTDVTTDPPTDCVFQCCAYMADKFGWSENTAGYYAGKFDSEYGDAANVTPAQAFGFLQSHFNTQNVDMSTLNGAISGNIMTDYLTSEGISHAVMLQFVDTASGFAYAYDPQNSTTVVMGVAELSCSVIVQVTGVKN